jgi:bifunctional DNase/RNase
VGKFFTVATLPSFMQAVIDAVRVAGTPEGPVPVVILGTDDEDDVLPIFIGFDEATAIARGLEAADIGRPLTHDLMLDVMEELGGRLDRVVVTAVEDATYLADLHLTDPRGEDVVVDARPSDGLAIAARTNAPIEVEESVFEDGRRSPEKFDELDDIREVSELA